MKTYYQKPETDVLEVYLDGKLMGEETSGGSGDSGEGDEILSRGSKKQQWDDED